MGGGQESLHYLGARGRPSDKSHLKKRGVGMSYIDRRGKASQRVRTGMHLVCAGSNKEASLLNHSD